MDDDRGTLPYALVHGEALVARAAWALGQADLTPVDTSLDWDVVVETHQPLVLHDALCPMTPPEFLASCVETAREQSTVVVAVRPVTDTVKVVADGVVGATVDREGLLAMASPVVLPAPVLATLDRWPGSDLPVVVATLKEQGHPVQTVLAPPQGRRVDSLESIQVLEALTAPR